MTPNEVYFNARPYSLGQLRQTLDLAVAKGFYVHEEVFEECSDSDSKLTHIHFSEVSMTSGWTDDSGEWCAKQGYTKLDTYNEIISWLLRADMPSNRRLRNIRLWESECRGILNELNKISDNLSNIKVKVEGLLKSLTPKGQP
jgi:hypothetical protein